MTRDIFISHAVKDKALANKLVDLLQLATGIDHRRIFCSSLEDMGIPAGANFVDHIKSQMQEPKVVIVLLTPNYLASQFCLCELGATWAMSHNMLPLIVKPLTFKDVSGVLLGTQLLKIEDSNDLSNMRDLLANSLGLQLGGTSRWDVKKGEFLKALPGILKKLPPVLTVDPATHVKLKAEFEDARATVEEMSAEIESLKDLNNKLSLAKSREDVTRINLEHKDVREALNDLETALADALKASDRGVPFVAFKELSQQTGVKLDQFRDQDTTRNLERAVDRRALDADESGWVSLNRSDRSVKEIIKAFDALEAFLSEAPEELSVGYEDESGVPLDLADRRYWEYALDPRIKSVDL